MLRSTGSKTKKHIAQQNMRTLNSSAETMCDSARLEIDVLHAQGDLRVNSRRCWIKSTLMKSASNNADIAHGIRPRADDCQRVSVLVDACRAARWYLRPVTTSV
jgi:hypothetical protein